MENSDGEWVDGPAPAAPAAPPAAPAASPAAGPSISNASKKGGTSTPSLPVAKVVVGKGSASSSPSSYTARTSPLASSSKSKNLARSPSLPSSSRSNKPIPPKSLRSAESSSRIDQLYESHKKTQEKLKKRRELEAASPKGCTFQPKLKKTQGKGSKGDKSAEGSRFERLYADHKAKQEKFQKARQSKLEEKCTFKPKINKPRRKKKSPSGQQTLADQRTGGSRHELLYKTASKYHMKKEKARETLGMEECTFSPKTNTRRRGGAPKSRSPLYDGDAIRMAADIRNQKSREHELKECTFEPNINRRGRNSMTVVDTKAVGERLYQNAADLRKKRMKAVEDAAAKEEVECTFSPKLAAKSSSISLVKSQGETAFNRLYDNAQKQREAREAAQQRASFQYEFKPKINGRSRELARHSDDRSLHEYLYKEGLAKTLQRQSQGDYKTSVRHRLEEEELELCTFDPKISKKERRRKKEQERAAVLKAQNDKKTLEALKLEKERILEEQRKVNAQAAQRRAEEEKQLAELGGRTSIDAEPSQVQVAEQISSNPGSTVEEEISEDEMW